MLLTNDEGIIEDIALFAANVDERDTLVDMKLPSMLLDAKGFIRPILKDDFARQGINLHTPLRSNMQESGPRSFTRWAASMRRLVKTVTSQVCERFEIERNRARHLWHLVSRLYREVAAHTLCVLLNR